jgi:hypothetical protein
MRQNARHVKQEAATSEAALLMHSTLVGAAQLKVVSGKISGCGSMAITLPP